MSTLDQLRTEFENLKARAANAEARATAAEDELKRYQRADVGERVREIQDEHDDAPNVPWEVVIRREHPSSQRCHEHRGELLDIARQQQAEIERLKDDLQLNEERRRLDMAMHAATADLSTIRARRARAWKRCARKWRHDHKIDTECLNRDIAELQDQLHDALEDVTEQQNKRHEAEERLREYEDKTEPQPKVEPELLGASESLPEAPTEEAYRPGLPPEALRKAWPEWEDSQGDRLRFTEDGERFGFLTLSGAAIESESTYIAEDSNGGQFAVCKHRPHGATWFEVEQRAARLLGEQDAKAGRDRKGDAEIEPLIGVRNQPVIDAYHAGYDGAIEYRDYKAIERAKVPPGLRTFIWEGAPDNQPLWRPSVDDCPIPWSRVGG